MQDHPDFSRFKIEGLRGRIDFDVKIKGNTLILVGENGSGKTTFLRILFYFLSGRWPSLAQFKFRKITATIGRQDYVLEYEDIQRLSPVADERILSRLSPMQRRRFLDLTEAGRYEESAALINQYIRRYGLLSDQAEFSFGKPDNDTHKLTELQEQLNIRLGAQILYLPTYRRIERELSSILQGYDPEERRSAPALTRQSDDSNDYVELVEFGMNDVKLAIDRTLEDIRNYQLQGALRLSLSYLGDVVSQSYLSTDSAVIANTSETNIQAVLDRIDETILSKNHKSHLREIIIAAQTTANVPSEHERIIYHYFAKLVSFQDEVRGKEANINQFCDLCSQYTSDKRFIYESAKPSFRIQSKSQETDVQISDLSSGEKQIVSLFSHLYLSGKERFFVLIDEPELSLSVPWQRRFLLDIVDASFCSGIIAVTHSPFIYDNKLRPHTHALGEFVQGPDWGNI